MIKIEATRELREAQVIFHKVKGYTAWPALVSSVILDCERR